MEAVSELTLAQISGKVDFSTEQVAKMCGVSRRQLAYWTQKGIIPGDGGYSLATVEKVSLIRQALDRGRTLRQAVRQVESRLTRRSEDQQALEGVGVESASALCAERLKQLEDLLQQVHVGVQALEAEARCAAYERIAALRIDEIVGATSDPLPPKDLALCLSWIIEHVEAVLDELPRG